MKKRYFLCIVFIVSPFLWCMQPDIPKAGAYAQLKAELDYCPSNKRLFLDKLNELALCLQHQTQVFIALETIVFECYYRYKRAIKYYLHTFQTPLKEEHYTLASGTLSVIEPNNPEKFCVHINNGKQAFLLPEEIIHELCAHPDTTVAMVGKRLQALRTIYTEYVERYTPLHSILLLKVRHAHKSFKDLKTFSLSSKTGFFYEKVKYVIRAIQILIKFKYKNFKADETKTVKDVVCDKDGSVNIRKLAANWDLLTSFDNYDHYATRELKLIIRSYSEVKSHLQELLTLIEKCALDIKTALESDQKAALEALLKEATTKKTQNKPTKNKKESFSPKQIRYTPRISTNDDIDIPLHNKTTRQQPSSAQHEQNLQNIPWIKVEKAKKVQSHASVLDTQTLTNSIIEQKINSIKLWDNKNKVFITIYTKHQNNPLLSFHFTIGPRVQEWFDSPEKTLQSQGYYNKEHKNYTPPSRIISAIVRHTFTKLVDKLLPKFGKQINKTLYLVGEIEWTTDVRDIGFFSYSYNNEGILFHRCFSKKVENAELGTFLYDGYWAYLQNE